MIGKKLPAGHNIMTPPPPYSINAINLYDDKLIKCLNICNYRSKTIYHHINNSINKVGDHNIMTRGSKWYCEFNVVKLFYFNQIFELHA